MRKPRVPFIYFRFLEPKGEVLFESGPTPEARVHFAGVARKATTLLRHQREPDESREGIKGAPRFSKGPTTVVMTFDGRMLYSWIGLPENVITGISFKAQEWMRK